MIVKIFYFNDERKDMTVRVLDLNYDPVNAKGDLYCSLKPAEGKLFDVSIPDGSVLYVKKWKDLVMISYMDPPVLKEKEDEQS